MSDPEMSYVDGNDAIRRNINETFYQRFYLDEQGVQESELNPPFEDLHAALTLTKKTTATTAVLTTAATKQGPLTGALDRVPSHRSSSGLAPTKLPHVKMRAKGGSLPHVNVRAW